MYSLKLVNMKNYYYYYYYYVHCFLVFCKLQIIHVRHSVSSTLYVEFSL
jgi:hypothetical protein